MHFLAFGISGEILFDHLGTVTTSRVPEQADRQFHATALRLARDAASRTRLEMNRPSFGRGNSETRGRFIRRVAELANEQAAKE
ncbi:MAG: hypothetical protein ACKVKF_11750 [Rhodobacterales bacterium]